MKKLILTLFLGLLAVSPGLADKKKDSKSSGGKTAVKDTTDVVWYSYDEGLKLARETQRPIMVNFTSQSCGYCKRMNRTTFKDSSVVYILNNDFVAVKVDGNSWRELDIDGYKISERNLAQAEYAVRGYPTYWFLKAGAEKIGAAPGYRAAGEFMTILCYIRDEAYGSMTFAEFVKNGGCDGSPPGKKN